MLTREQILEIGHYCAEHKMSLEARMDEIGVPHHQILSLEEEISGRRYSRDWPRERIFRSTYARRHIRSSDDVTYPDFREVVEQGGRRRGELPHCRTPYSIGTNAMCERLRSGDVFIFVNSSRNMMKMLRQEEGGLVLYSIRRGQVQAEVQDGQGPGNHDAAVRAAIVYSLFSSCKAAGIEARAWLEDILVRLPGHNGDLGCLLPGNWRK